MVENDVISRKWLLDHYDAEHQGPPGRARALIESAPALPYAPVNPARWEKVRFEGSNTPYWRCSNCKDACFPAPDGLDRVYYCPKCGAYTGGKVDCVCLSCKHYHESIHDRGDDSRCALHNRETRALLGCEKWEERNV